MDDVVEQQSHLPPGDGPKGQHLGDCEVEPPGAGGGVVKAGVAAVELDADGGEIGRGGGVLVGPNADGGEGAVHLRERVLHGGLVNPDDVDVVNIGCDDGGFGGGRLWRWCLVEDETRGAPQSDGREVSDHVVNRPQAPAPARRDAAEHWAH